MYYSILCITPCTLSHSRSKYLFSDIFFLLKVICSFGPRGGDDSAVTSPGVLLYPLFFLHTLLTPPQIILKLLCHLFPAKTLTNTGKKN